MPFRIVKAENTSFATPQEMFQDNKLKNIMGLMDYQSKMIDHYMSTLQEDGKIVNKHVAFELPTGSGKTLIGLLIGEFHRRKYRRKVLYLCPTNQLVVQVCQQAKMQYGIEAVAFCGKQSDYSPADKSDYLLAKKLGVTTYSSFFASSEYFDGVEVIIFDDVHSSEQYIAENWSVNIQRNGFETLYRELAEVIRDTPVGESFYTRMVASSPFISDITGWCNMIPLPLIQDKIQDKIQQISKIISANVENTQLSYPWSRIRDHIEECNIFVSWESVLIRPYIPPTLSFPPFKNALQCIYMSATLGKSGELERIIGVDSIKTLPIVNEWDKKAIGRKFFLFPDLSFDTKLHGEIILKLHNVAKKSVIIVPNNKEQDELSKIIESMLPDTALYTAQDLIGSKEDFKHQDNAIVIIANRFDGIAFPDDESRMLILHNLPKTTHLQEKFFYSRMAASVLFSERIKTRIVQAVGRCTRNAKDYAVVCILGNSILNDLITDNHLIQYKPEMRAEIQFGIDNSTNLSSIEELLSNVELFLSRDASWSDAEEHIVGLRDRYIEEESDQQNELIYSKLKDAAGKEVDVQYYLWKKDYVGAFNNICEIISILTAPKLRGYQAFWQYYAGYIGQKLGKDYSKKTHELFKTAAQGVLGISWLANLAEDDKIAIESGACQNGFDSIVERLEERLDNYKSPIQLEKEIKEIIEGLTNSIGESFESFHTRLGSILGYEASNPKGDGDPDPYWIINDDVCIVAEDKIYESEDKKIPLAHISQAVRHEKWIREKIPTLHKGATVYTIFVSNATSIEESARIHADNIYYCNRTELINWAHTALRVLRDCYNTFSGEGNAEWREHAKAEFIRNNVTPADFIQMITKIELKSI